MQEIFENYTVDQYQNEVKDLDSNLYLFLKEDTLLLFKKTKNYLPIGITEDDIYHTATEDMKRQFLKKVGKEEWLISKDALRTHRKLKSRLVNCMKNRLTVGRKGNLIGAKYQLRNVHDVNFSNEQINQDEMEHDLMKIAKNEPKKIEQGLKNIWREVQFSNLEFEEFENLRKKFSNKTTKEILGFNPNEKMKMAKEITKSGKTQVVFSLEEN